MSRREVSFSFFLSLLTLLHVVACLDMSESEALVTFLRSLENVDKLDDWVAGKGKPCSGNKARWVGVRCSDGHVSGLDLDNMGLRGIVNVDALKELKYLRTLSLVSNNFVSTLPDFKHVAKLESLNLANNSFTGEIHDDAFENMSNLKRVDMRNNKFIGTIPASLATLGNLVELRLEGNQFEGIIPDFMIKENLKIINVSHNHLEGPIPKSLSKMSVTSFQGNKALCGAPLEKCHDHLNNPITTNKKRSILSLVALSVTVLAALVAIGAVILIMLRQRNHAPTSIEDPPSRKRNKNPKSLESDKLTVLRESGKQIDLQEMLKASTEALETSGSFGFSYKARLGMGKVVVMKRYKKLNNVGKREFDEHMRMLGRLNHPNLLPTVGYLYNKEDKVLISDYVEMGSLATRIHGHQPSLNWATRLKIVKGIAKGLEYLYKELPSIVTPHGHLKSSKVLLNDSYEPLLADYGLTPIVNQEDTHQLMVAYKSPEYVHHDRVTKKTDVWAFGILILEILTGRFPAKCLGKTEAGMDLVTWARSIFHGELLVNVIDKELRMTKTSEGEILKLMKIALECCEEEVERRPDMREVAEKVRELEQEV